jgi:predicted deacylase
MAAGMARRDFTVPGTTQLLTVFTITGARPGPTLATIGAVHGDELEGPLTLSSLLTEIDSAALSGTWIVCPVANGEAVSAYRRTSPSDGKNLARVFPGRLDGSYTEAVAALITEHVITPADYLIDLHSGGISTDATPVVGYQDSPGIGPRSKAMAEAFGWPFVWRHEPPTPPGRTLSVADDRGIPAVYTEAGGGTFPAAELIELYRRGVRGVMAHLGMYAAPDGPAPTPALHVVGNGNTDTNGPSPETGICTSHIEVGQKVDADTLCFTISGLDGKPIRQVLAGTSGYVIFARRNRWVEKGEMLMTLAVEDR